MILRLVVFIKISSASFSKGDNYIDLTSTGHMWQTEYRLWPCLDTFFVYVEGPRIKMSSWCPYGFISYCTLSTTSLHVLKFTVSWGHFCKQFWRRTEYLINCHPRRFEGNTGEGRSILNIDTASSLLFTTVKKNQSFFLVKAYRTLRKKKIPRLHHWDFWTSLQRHWDTLAALCSLPEDNFWS